MSTQGNTAKYIELFNQPYEPYGRTFASAVPSRFGYSTSVRELAARPNASTAIASSFGENFERASELAKLGLGELRAGQGTIS